MEKLVKIQSALKVPKNQFNKFGNYKYRSTEDILEAVKPLLAKEGLTLVIEDDIAYIGDRFYVKATCRISAKDGTTIASNTAFAREAEKKKGMDEAQVTGAASSYARKYALAGLFLCDDTKDMDGYDNTEQKQKQQQRKQQNNQQPQQQQPHYTQQQYNNMRQKLTTWSIDNQEMSLKWLNYYKVNGINQLNNSQILEMGMKIFKK